MSRTTLSAAFNALDSGRTREQDRQTRTAFVALLGALDREENGEVRRALEHSDVPSRFHLEDRKSGTSLSLEIGARERGCLDRVVTLSFVLKGEHILTVAQTRREWNERSSGATVLEGTPDDLLTLSAAMACLHISHDKENPGSACFVEALCKKYFAIREEDAQAQENQAQSAVAGILAKLNQAENGGIHEAFISYDRLSLFSHKDGDTSVGLQIGPRAKINNPRTVTIFVFCKDTPILEVSQTRHAWHEPSTAKNAPEFHTGTLQTLLDLNSVLNNPEALSKASIQEAPRIPDLA